MRAVVFGAKGQLGRDLMTLLAAEGEVAGYDLPDFDIADGEATLEIVSRFAPDVVVNAAAYTDVERAESEREAAFLANETGARNAAAAAHSIGVPVVYYSTDFVFGGEKATPYETGEPVRPRGVYAESKAAGEQATREACERHFIVRTAWLYGPGGNNFVEKILRAAQTRPSLKVVDDEVGSPTHTWDLAEATCRLVKSDAYGDYHAVNAGACSRFEFAKAILEEAGLVTPVEPCSSDAFPTAAPRPKYSVLAVDKLESVTGYAMRPWREALHAYMKRRET